MSYAIVGILVVAFIAFVALSAKSWHWSNIVFLSLTFLAGLGSLVAMSQVLDSRTKVMKEARKSAMDLQTVKDQIQTVLHGPGLAYRNSEDSLRGRSEALSLELAGRGRLWKNGQITVNGTKRVFKFTSDRVTNPENPASMQDMILFAYSDRVFENDENIYPAVFVGSFRVVGETLDSIEMEPVFISNEPEFNEPTSSWTLYEKSPVDQRDAYIRDTDIVLELNDPNLNDKLTEYRNILEQQQLSAEMFGFDLSDQAQAQEYEMVIDRIMFDGLPLVKIESWIETQPERISKRFDPAPGEIFVRYIFEEKSNRPYQVDATGNIDNDGQFTKTGYAVDPSLHAGGEIEFQKGDEILVDQLTADGYQRGDEPVPSFSTQEPVTEVDRRFVRQLNDYPFLLKTLKRQNELYAAEIERVKLDNQNSGQAISNAETQASIRDTEIEQLFADQQNFEKDVRIVKDFLDSTRIRKSEVEMSIVELESKIRSNSRMLRAIANLMAEKAARMPTDSLEVISVNDEAPFLAPSSGASSLSPVDFSD